MQKKAIGIRLSNNQIKKLENIANKKERTLSEQIRIILQNYIEQIEA